MALVGELDALLARDVAGRRGRAAAAAEPARARRAGPRASPCAARRRGASSGARPRARIVGRHVRAAAVRRQHLPDEGADAVLRLRVVGPQLRGARRPLQRLRPLPPLVVDLLQAVDDVVVVGRAAVALAGTSSPASRSRRCRTRSARQLVGARIARRQLREPPERASAHAAARRLSGSRPPGAISWRQV